MRKKKLLVIGVVMALSAASADAQVEFHQSNSQYCGERAAEYCWENEGDGYGTGTQCIDAIINDWCPPDPNPDPGWSAWGPRDYAVKWYSDIERHCGSWHECNSGG